MRTKRQKGVRIIVLAVVGAIIGSLAGLWLGRVILLRAAKTSLAAYTQELNLHVEELTGELSRVFREVNASGFSHCSEEDLSYLRAETFSSRVLKDIGRTHAGLLHCSAFLGILKKPYNEGDPTMTFADGTRIYASVPLVLASYHGDHGTVVELGDTNIVVGPDAFDHWERPHVRYLVAAVDRSTGRVAPILGSLPGVDPAWLITSQPQQSSRGIYRSQCSTNMSICVAVVEDISDILESSKTMQSAYLELGGLAGFGLGLSVALLYLQSTDMSHKLQRAVRRNSQSIRVVYEPIVDISRRRCVGAEALLRWTVKNGVTVSPDVFIGIAEQNGFIFEITALVVRRAIGELGALLRDDPTLTLSINIAVTDLYGDRLFRLLRDTVQAAGIRPRQIALELTERSTAELGVVRDAIQKFRRQGYEVRIDDFGTGFSSLSYLDQLDVNTIKIDRSFTRTMGTDAVTASILPQIIAMAECLELDVIVEGVETDAQLAHLEAMGKSLQIQGWYFGKPMSAAAFAAFTRQQVKIYEVVAAKRDSVNLCGDRVLPLREERCSIS